LQPVYTDCIEPLLDLMHSFNKADTSSGCSTAGYSNPVSLWLPFFASSFTYILNRRCLELIRCIFLQGGTKHNFTA
jgi:hypothetical protein